jgi:HAD superfamily hydrolase (TIGR01509 family)
MNFIQKLYRPMFFSLAMLTALAGTSRSFAYSPADTVVAFDIHDVLMQLAAEVVKRFIKKPALVFRIPRLVDGSYGNDRALRKVINSQKPIEKTWKLARELKASGYSLYIFSNIDSKAFDELKVKFPGYFDIFDGCHVVHKNNSAHKKPAPSAYDSCKALIAQQHPGKQIVFIDDKKENIKAACNAGFKGIRFKSADQLKNTLKVCYNIHLE